MSAFQDSDSRDHDLLVRATSSALPGWQFLGRPEPFGWAPDHHLRACLRDPGGTEWPVILRQAWGSESFSAEVFAYRELLPQLPLRTARLWATFRIGEEQDWMVLEDLGPTTADPSHRDALLRTLGSLHGAGALLLSDLPADHPLPSFDAAAPDHQRWADLLTRHEGMLPQGATGVFARVLRRLADQPTTLLHGDTDLSNAVLIGEEVALVDWEKVMLGPAALDLGRLVKHLGDPTELSHYRAAYRATGSELSEEELQPLFELADGFDCVRWICYCLDRTEAENDPGTEWREMYYAPRLERLHVLAERWGIGK